MSRPAHGKARGSAIVGCSGIGAWLLSGCLVTEKIDYNTPNVPAQVIKVAPEDFAAVPEVSECGEEGTSGSTPWLELQFDVRDPDIEDKLLARIIVNNKDAVTTLDVPVNGRADRERISYCVQREYLERPCLHLEVLVSNKFVDNQGNQTPYLTEDPHDVGYAEWWLLGPSRDYPEVGVSACQTALQGEP